MANPGAVEREETMTGKHIKLFNLFGFEVKVDLSWTIIAVLIVWSLSVGVLPRQYKDLSAQTYWIMGVAGAVGLFLSIILSNSFRLWRTPAGLSDASARIR